eukprot:3123456-Prymnesium_polylepis.1
MQRASTRAWCNTALRGTTQCAATHNSQAGVVAWVMTLRHKGQSGVCVSSSHASLDGAGCAVAGLRACVKAGVIVLTQPHCDQTCHTTNDHT